MNCCRKCAAEKAKGRHGGQIERSFPPGRTAMEQKQPHRKPRSGQGMHGINQAYTQPIKAGNVLHMQLLPALPEHERRTTGSFGSGHGSAPAAFLRPFPPLFCCPSPLAFHAHLCGMPYMRLQSPNSTFSFSFVAFLATFHSIAGRHETLFAIIHDPLTCYV